MLGIGSKSFYCILLIAFLLNVGACKQVHIVNKEKLKPVYTESYCFMDGFPAYGYYQIGNAILNLTDRGNFLKYTALNDSQYVFTCGNGNREFALFKGKCNEMHNVPELHYDDEARMILYQKGGSDNWEYTYIDFAAKKVTREHSIYLDTATTWHVAWFANSEDVFLQATNERMNTTHKLKTKYYQIRKSGYPQFFLHDVYVDGNKLYYSVENEQQQLVSDSLLLIEP